MNLINEDTLVIQREKLRHQLQEQRKLIAQQLAPIQGAHTRYPRSMTVRFFTQRQPLITKLLTEVMIVVVSARLYKFLSALLILVRFIHSRSINSQKRLSGSVRHRTEPSPVERNNY